MTGNTVLRWPDGEGWLVFSGGTDAHAEVRAQVLSRARADGGVAYIGLNVDDDEATFEDMAELGAPAGYLVDILTEDDDTIRRHLEEAAIVVIPEHLDYHTLRDGLMGATLAGLRAAYERGAVLLIEGQAIRLFGAVTQRQPLQPLEEAFGWLEAAFLLPAVSSINESDSARSALEQGRARIAVGIAVGSALALGPRGEVELWGGGQVTVALAGMRASH